MAGAAVLLAGFAASQAKADAVDDFYKGKQTIMVVSAAAGAGYDALGRVVARHMPRFMPTNPTMIVQNMPGAAGLTAASWLYNAAPKDGTVVALLQRNALTAKLIGREGARFDPAQFNWVGNISRETSVVVAWKDSPIQTTDGLFKSEMVIGGTSPANDTVSVPRLLNAMIGTKFKIISGYKSTEDIVLAMQRGEVQGMGNWGLSNVLSRHAEELNDKQLAILLQVAETRVPALPNVPSALEFVKNDQDREVLQLFLAQKSIARPVAAPPGVPAERIAALRKAFMAIFDDAQFKADAEKAGLEIEPSSADEINRIMGLINATPPDVAKRFGDIIDPKG
ncbi:MAG TPA: tripartite tricarboxylate transporter substrate-binding protein [Alphaproteobacteria bacterium]